MQCFDIAMMDVRDFARSEARKNLILDHLPIVHLRTLGLFRKMFDAIPFSQVGYSRRFAPFALFTRRIFTAVDSTAKFLRLVPRRLRRPFWKAPDSVPAFASVDAVVHEERSGALRAPPCRREHAHTEPSYLGVPNRGCACFWR